MDNYLPYKNLNQNQDSNIRCAAYCRVSTDKLDQVNSLESQKRFFTDYINREPFWELTEVYVDEGISGTSTKKRQAFNRMIQDARDHKFDRIITKEISRFARNTLDSIYYTRELKKLGIGVIFMNDGINTMDPDAELRLTILASIAQEESRKTSSRVKWGQKRRMEQGVVFGRDMLGYDIRNGNLYINEEGAKTVRLIFHKFVEEGKGSCVIARELRDAGIRTSTYMKQWSHAVILKILRNEKYCGDLVQKKTYTPDYLSHEKKINKGQEEFVVLRDHHEPIISRELFEKAQRELQRRSPSTERKSKHSNRYCFSGKIVCGDCGATYVARFRKRAKGGYYKSWCCFERANRGLKHIDKNGDELGCCNMIVRNNDLESILMQVVHLLFVDRESLIKNLTDTISAVFKMDESEHTNDQTQNQIDALLKRKQTLLDAYLDKVVSKEDYRYKSNLIEQEIESYRSKLKEIKNKEQLRADQDQILSNARNFIRSLVIGDTWDDTFYRNILDKIVIFPDRTIDIHLKLIDEKWSYLLSKTDLIKNSSRDISDPDPSLKCNNNINLEKSVIPVPMSVNIAFSSG